MLTRCVSFLQLGDIHYPELLKARPLVDAKDKGLSADMIGAVSSSRITEVMRGINQVRKDEASLVAVVLTGDLTTIGNVVGYKDCLTYLHAALQATDHTYWKDRRLLVVPGNHDILRSTIEIGQPLLVKFEPLLQQWEAIFGAREFLTVDAPIPIDLAVGIPDPSTPSIRFLPINTCLFCGEHRAFPDQIRSTVADSLKKLKTTIPHDEFEKLLSEQIDCPAVSRDHAQQLGTHISAGAANSISVAVGHHPLFAQPMPRLAGYSELLNAGYVRETMLETRRNVIYLHGHIHQDPVLLVTSPIKGSHRLIHISAPELADGFNLIRIIFSSETGQPLGLELIQHRFGDHLGLVKRDSIRLCLVDHDSFWNEIDDPWMKYVLEKLNSPQYVLRFNDLMKAIPPRLKSTADPSKHKELLSDALRILELVELIEIVNRDGAVALWQCRRKAI